MSPMLNPPNTALLIYFESLVLWLYMFALDFWCYHSLWDLVWLCSCGWSRSKWSWRIVIHSCGHICWANITGRCIDCIIVSVFRWSKRLEIFYRRSMYWTTSFQCRMSHHVVKWILVYGRYRRLVRQSCVKAIFKESVGICICCRVNSANNILQAWSISSYTIYCLWLSDIYIDLVSGAILLVYSKLLE